MDSVSVAFELMRIALDAEVEDLNAKGADLFKNSKYSEAEEQIVKGKKLRSFLTDVQALEARWANEFAGTIHALEDTEVVQETVRRINSSSKSSATSLMVKFPNGDVISEDTAAGTLCSVIARLGFERVEEAGVTVNGENIVSRTPSPKYYETKSGLFYIKTHSNTESKKRQLERISDFLGAGLTVRVV